MDEWFNERVTGIELERECVRLGKPGLFWMQQPNRQFDDLPTRGELLEWIKLNTP